MCLFYGKKRSLIYDLIVAYHYRSLRLLLSHMLRVAPVTCTTTSAFTDAKFCLLACEEISIAHFKNCTTIPKIKLTWCCVVTYRHQTFPWRTRQTNICCVTRKHFFGIIQARCSCCMLNDNFRIFSRSLCIFACFDVKYLHFFKHFIWTYKSTSLSIECCRRWIAWLKEWASNILGFLQASVGNSCMGNYYVLLCSQNIVFPVLYIHKLIIPHTWRTYANFSWRKNPFLLVMTINLKEKWDAKVCIFRSLWQLYLPLQSSSKYFKVPSYLLPCSVSFDFWN